MMNTKLIVTITFFIVILLSPFATISQKISIYTDENALLPATEVKTQVMNRIKVDKKIFSWKNANDKLLYSAIIHSDSLAVIGFKPSKIKNHKKKLDANTMQNRKWINANLLLKKRILTYIQNKYGTKYSESYIFPKMNLDERLPFFYFKIFDFELLEELRSDPKVRYIEPSNFQLNVSGKPVNIGEQQIKKREGGCGQGKVHPRDKIYLDNSFCDFYSWNYALHNIPQAWEASINKGAGINLGIFDGDVSQNLEIDFDKGESIGRTFEGENYYTFTVDCNSGNIDPTDIYGSCSSHGTKVAGVLAGPKTNEEDAIGIAYKANLNYYKVAFTVVLAPCEIVFAANAIMDVLDSDVRLISMSLGTELPPIIFSPLEDALNIAFNQDVLVFAAAGSSTDIVDVVYPATSEFTTAITGLNIEGETCAGCNDGAEVDFVAFMQISGTDIDIQDLNTNIRREVVTYGEQYVGQSSSATPIIAGIAALVWADNPNWSRQQVIDRLIFASSNSARDDEHGWGTVDAYKAITGSENPAPEPEENFWACYNKVAFFEGFDETIDFVCEQETTDGLIVDFTEEDACDNDDTKSITLFGVPAGKVFKLFDNSEGKTDDDWLEVRVKQDLTDKIIPNLETSFEDDDVRVIYHHDNDLNGKVSRYEASSTPSGPMIDFYASDNVEDGLMCSVEIETGYWLNFTATGSPCSNDDARSAKLYDIPENMRIRLFDNTRNDNPFSEDWLEIYAKRDIIEYTLNNLEIPFENDDLKVTFNEVDGLNGKVSYMEVDETGCRRESACNYSPTATVDDGSCYGCNDEQATNNNCETTTTNCIFDSSDICFLSYNTQLLNKPDINGESTCGGTDCNTVATDVCNFVFDLDKIVDIIQFQEAFDDDAREVLMNCVESNGYTCIASNNGTNLGIAEMEGAGLVTCYNINKLSLTNSTFTEYNDCHGLIDFLGLDGCDSDCLGKKGFLSLELLLPNGCKFTSINTHLDAGGCDGDFEAREQQLIQLSDFINLINDGEPIFIGGDWNIKFNSDEYNMRIEEVSNNLGGTTITPFAMTYPNSTEIAPTASYNGAIFTNTLDYFWGINVDNGVQNTSVFTYEDINLACNYTIYAIDYLVFAPDTYPYNATSYFLSLEEANNFLSTVFGSLRQIFANDCRCGITSQPCPPSDHLPTGFCFELNCNDDPNICNDPNACNTGLPLPCDMGNLDCPEPCDESTCETTCIDENATSPIVITDGNFVEILYNSENAINYNLKVYVNSELVIEQNSIEGFFSFNLTDCIEYQYSISILCEDGSWSQPRLFTNVTDNCEMNCAAISNADLSVNIDCDNVCQIVSTQNGLLKQYRYTVKNENNWIAAIPPISGISSVGVLPDCSIYEFQIREECTPGSNTWSEWSVSKEYTIVHNVDYTSIDYSISGSDITLSAGTGSDVIQFEYSINGTNYITEQINNGSFTLNNANANDNVCFKVRRWACNNMPACYSDEICVNDTGIEPPDDNTNLFVTYDWINELVNLDNCNGSSITVLEYSGTIYIVVSDPINEKLYREDGTLICSQPGCVTVFAPGATTIDTWSCVLRPNRADIKSKIATGSVDFAKQGAGNLKTTYKFNIIPNPATNQVYIYLNDEYAKQNQSIHIFDLTGQKIHQVDLDEENYKSIVVFDFTNAAKGMYLVKWQSNNAFETQKLIIN